MPMPPVPKQRLAVIVEPVREFGKRLKDLGRASSSVSGITGRDNLMILSGTPNNELFQNLKINLDDVCSKRNDTDNLKQDRLVSGELWKSEDSWYPDPQYQE